jgi:formate dehydrogenase subunit delta
MSPDKMVYQANQIATFMVTQVGDSQVAGIGGITHHLHSFWEARMLTQLYKHIDAGGAGLHPMVIAAAQRLRAPAIP